jgi:hypothetical protein
MSCRLRYAATASTADFPTSFVCNGVHTGLRYNVERLNVDRLEIDRLEIDRLEIEFYNVERLEIEFYNVERLEIDQRQTSK